jgi:hypothetical protein
VRVTPLPILIMDLLFRRRFWAFGIFRSTSIIDNLLSSRLSRKFPIGLQLFSLMLMTAFGFNCFPNTNLGFLGLIIFGLDLFCETLDEAVRPGSPRVRPVWAPVRPVRASVRLVIAQPAPMPLFCCPPERRSTRCSLYALVRGF